MFTSIMTTDKKEQVLKLFTEQDGNLRLLIATTSFGVGIDCPNIRRILHWGVPTTLEEYAQEIGRAGRDDKPTVAIYCMKELEEDMPILMLKHILN